MISVDKSDLVRTLAEVLAGARAVGADFPIDVRLQVHSSKPNDYTVRWGDPSFDTDHTGYWGWGELAADATEADMAALAESLIDDAAEACAQEGPTKLDEILAANALCSFFGRFDSSADVDAQAMVDLLGCVKSFGYPPSACDYYVNTNDGWALERKGAHLFQFGPYHCSQVLAFGSLEDALEGAAETLREVAPGHFSDPEYPDMTGMSEAEQQAAQDAAETDMTYTESGWLLAHEWAIGGTFHSYDALVSYVRDRHGEDLDRR